MRSEVVRSPYRGTLYGMTPAEAQRVLDCSAVVLAALVVADVVRVRVGMRPYPTWSSVRVDARSVAAVSPDELARAREAAPSFRVPEIGAATALGMVLRALAR